MERSTTLSALFALAALAAPVHGRPAAVPDDELFAVLRALDADGKALEVDALELQVSEHDDERITVWRPATEALEGGRVRVALGEPGTGECTLVLTTARAGPSGHGARIDLSRLGPGVHELGNVTLAPPPLLVTGTVLDPAGVPVVGAHVQLEQRWMGASREPATWSSVTGVTARTAGRGRFVLRGWTGTDELRASADARGFSPAVLEVRAGEQQAELRLAPTGGIAGSALLDAACGFAAVEAECARGGAPLRSVPLGADGGFSISGLAAGRYSIRLRARNDAAIVYEAGDVEVRSGETARDPRLQDTDLRGKVRCITVRLIAPAGAELPWFVFDVGAAGTDATRSFWARGDIELATSVPAVDLSFQVPGYRGVRLDALEADRAVELRPGLPVRVALDGGLPTLREGFTLRVHLHPDSARRPNAANPTLLDERGEALLRASDPGEQVLVLYVRREGTKEDYSLPDGLATPARVVLGDGDEEQRVRVELDRDALARFVDKLAE